MNFFLFAAGLGMRLRPLTLHTPKPLINVGGQTLLGRLLEQILPYADTVFINVCWLGEQIEAFIHQHYASANIIILREQSPLETGGAIINALEYEKKHLLDTTLAVQPFALVNADIYTDYDFSSLNETVLKADDLAHLVLVDRPSNRESGDFNLTAGRVSGSQNTRGDLVFSGISVIHPKLIKQYQQHHLATANETPTQNDVFSLSQVYYYASSQGHLSGEHFNGQWFDVGTKKVLDLLSH